METEQTQNNAQPDTQSPPRQRRKEEEFKGKNME